VGSVALLGLAGALCYDETMGSFRYQPADRYDHRRWLFNMSIAAIPGQGRMHTLSLCTPFIASVCTLRPQVLDLETGHIWILRP
jgi:hypothetical protein